MAETLDQATLSQIRDLGGDELLHKLVSMFLENTPLRLEEIRRGLKMGDLARTEVAAHSLRSSSITLGATGVSELAAAVERMARAGDEAALREALPRLGKRVEDLYAEFGRLLET